MKQFGRILKTWSGAFAGVLVVLGIWMFAADIWSLAGHDISVHGDGPTGGIIVGPSMVFLGVLLFAWLWHRRSVLD